MPDRFERSAKSLMRTALLAIVTAIPLAIPFASVEAQPQPQLQALVPGRSPSQAPIRGMVRALEQSAIGIDIPVRLQRIHVREAQAFKKGDLLLEFDCERLEAELAAAEATTREMKLALDSNLYLDEKKAIGRLDVEVSRARADKASAEARALKSRIKQCKLSAPFDGRVVELSINEHEFPVQGRPFITLVNEANFEIDLIVPSHYLQHIQPGTSFSYRIDETGREYEAEILRVGAAVDPVSQTIKVIAKFAKPVTDVLAGMSGSASLLGRETSQ